MLIKTYVIIARFLRRSTSLQKIARQIMQIMRIQRLDLSTELALLMIQKRFYDIAKINKLIWPQFSLILSKVSKSNLSWHFRANIWQGPKKLVRCQSRKTSQVSSELTALAYFDTQIFAFKTERI